MKNPNDRSKPKADLQAKDYGNAALGLLRAGANAFLPLFRYGMGDRHYKLGLLTLAPMVAIAPASPAMMVYVVIWLLFLCTSRIDRNAHSNWGGFSRVRSRLVEPFIVFAAGVCFMEVDEAFAAFCFVGGMCMLMLAAHEHQQVSLYRRKLRDQQQEMAFMSQMGRRR